MEGGFGWVVVGATFVINGIVQGVIASTGVLLNVLLDEFKVGKSTTGWIPSLLGGLLLAVGPFSSYLIQRSSCRTVTIIGAVVAASGCFLSVFATGVRFLIFSYGIVTGFGFGLLYLPQTIVLAEWFKETRSTATGVGLSGAGIGAFIIPPLSQFVLHAYGWRTFFFFVGVLVSSCSLFGILLRPNPEGRNEEQRDVKAAAGSTSQAPTVALHFLRDSAFVVFCCSTSLFSGSYRIPFSFLPDYAVRQLNSSKEDAAYLLSYLGFASFLGRLIGGYVGDNQRNRRFLVYMGLNVVAGLSVAGMGIVENYFQLSVCSLGYGAASGGRVALNSIILADIFGLAVLTQTFGLVCLVQGISIFFGTPIAGALADFFGDYRTSFVVFGITMMMCASVLTFIPVPRRSHISNYAEKRVAWFLRILPMVIVPFLLGNTVTPVQASKQVVSTPPNIVLIMADDLGWNDVSFHGYNEISTPFIDKLAGEGVILNSHYAQYMCTPSRSALLTGKYPIRTGLQHYVLRVGEPRDLPLGEKLLPEYLKELGYASHLVGKWHLGYSRKQATPTYRGFDSFFGYYTGSNDYYNYTPGAHDPEYSAFDLWEGLQPGKEYVGRYSTELFSQKAVNRIEQHDFSKPLFLFLSHMASHYGDNDPVQAPQEYIDRFPNIVHEGRRKYAATVSVLDDSVGKVYAALEKKGALENTVILFISDNGGAGPEQGAHFGPPSTFANNWPLRGAKASQFEGGVRVSGFIWSHLLGSSSRVNNELYHISDWLPTFVHLAGGAAIDGLDGMNIWSSISENLPSPRTEIVHQIDPVWHEYAIRSNQYKLISGSRNGQNGHRIDDWYEPVNGLNQRLIVDAPSALKCKRNPADVPCHASIAPCLFDIIVDPCEYNNLAEKHPDVVQFLMTRIRVFNATALHSNNLPLNPKAKAVFNLGLMRPWLD